MSDLDPILLRNAFGKFMTGVTVVTTIDSNGTPLGFTANSFSSVSLDPPLLLVCPAKSMSSFSAFESCEAFHVSVLAHNQQSISNTFASSVDDRFSDIKWHNDELGSPSIEGAIATFTCLRKQSIEAGDHIILLGEVVDFSSTEEHGLGYSEGGYFSLEMERKAAELQNRSQQQPDSVIAGALLEHDSQLLLKSHPENPDKLILPHIELEGEEPSFDELDRYLTEDLGLKVSIGSVFSIFDHQTSGKTSIYYRVTLDHESPTEVEGFAFHELQTLRPESFASKSTVTMIERYLSEHESGNHSIYIGTDALGKTHRLSGGKK